MIAEALRVATISKNEFVTRTRSHCTQARGGDLHCIECIVAIVLWAPLHLWRWRRCRPCRGEGRSRGGLQAGKLARNIWKLSGSCSRCSGGWRAGKRHRENRRLWCGRHRGVFCRQGKCAQLSVDVELARTNSSLASLLHSVDLAHFGSRQCDLRTATAIRRGRSTRVDHCQVSRRVVKLHVHISSAKCSISRTGTSRQGHCRSWTSVKAAVWVVLVRATGFFLKDVTCDGDLHGGRRRSRGGRRRGWGRR